MVLVRPNKKKEEWEPRSDGRALFNHERARLLGHFYTESVSKLTCQRTENTAGIG
jgi:hypothetical protein